MDTHSSSEPGPVQGRHGRKVREGSERDEFGRAQGRAALEDLPAGRITPSGKKGEGAPGRPGVGGGQDLKAADADDGALKGEPQSLCEGQAHAQSGEGAGAEGDGDPVKVREGEARRRHDLPDQGGETLLVAALHGLAGRGGDPVPVEDGDGAGREAGIEGEDPHGAG